MMHEDVIELISAPCPLCGGHEIEEIWQHSSGIVNGICKTCGHVHLSRRFPDKVIAESYQTFGQSYTDEFLADENNSLFAIARKRFEFLKTHLPSPPDDVLEIGCGYGHFLKVMDGASLKVGIEPSSAQASFARSTFGLDNIVEGTYETSLPILNKGTNQRFDAVCSFHVIEHLICPVSFIKQVREQLRPGGYLFLALPNLFTLSPDLIELYFIYRNWHIHSFSPLSIARMLGMNGFEIIVIEEEQPSSMHPSDLMVLVQRTEAAFSNNNFHNVYEENYPAAIRFHQSSNDLISSLRSAFSEWRASHKRVAIYGGGIHTYALFNLTGINSRSVMSIVDDDPNKIGSDILGIPIFSLDKVVKEGIDVVVVSSLASENTILQRLESLGMLEGVEIKGVYRDYLRCISSTIKK